MEIVAGMLALSISDMLMIETFFFLLIATIQDFRKREVYDLVNYGFIITSLFLRIMWFIVDGNISAISLVIPSFAIVFLFSYVLYRTGQWGGGDVKTSLGISIALAASIENIIGFFMNLILFGAVFGILYSLIVGLMNWKKFITNFDKRYRMLSLVSFLLAGLSYIILTFYEFFPMIPIAVSFTFIIIGLIKPIEIIEKNCFVKTINVDKLVEGDWLVDDIKGIKNRGIGLTSEDIEKIKKQGLKKVLVKEGVPFIPAFLIAFVVNVFLGNIFVNIASSFSSYQYRIL
jgi:Flp pilus assembly protein protease CpaA